MSALTGAEPRTRWDLSEQKPLVREMVVKAANTLYAGSYVGKDGANAVPTNGTFPLLGVSQNNYAAGETAIIEFWHCIVVPISGVTKANLGAAVYATTDNDLTLSVQTSILGTIIDVPETGTAIVHVTLRAGV